MNYKINIGEGFNSFITRISELTGKTEEEIFITVDNKLNESEKSGIHTLFYEGIEVD